MDASQDNQSIFYMTTHTLTTVFDNPIRYSIREETLTQEAALAKVVRMHNVL